MTIICGADSVAAAAYAEAHPDGEGAPVEAGFCCQGAAYRGLAACTCWEPVYDVEQAPARTELIDGVPRTELPARPSRCSDCAYRRDSPERADDYSEEQLLGLALCGEPFWCHDGLRRPASWRHSTLGVTLPGDPDDWKPLIVGGVPYRADGSPALLCAGWAHQRASEGAA